MRVTIGLSWTFVTLGAFAACGGGSDTPGNPTPPTTTATPLPPVTTPPVTGPAGPIPALVAVATGGAHTCALAAGGTPYCWGRAESGQLGSTPSTICVVEGSAYACSVVPRVVDGGPAFTQITAGGTHTCALTGGGAAYCWGLNSSGQLGIGTTASSAAPVPVAGGLAFARLDAGGAHTCGLTFGGAAYCWGRNDRGQLGTGSNVWAMTPAPVAGGITFQSLTAGGFNSGHTCGLDTAGAAWCWGDNERGQLGRGTSDVDTHLDPAPVVGGHLFVALSAGLGRHTCGATQGGARCWGENSFGALGNGSTAHSPIPVEVTAAPAFTRVAAGGFIGHTCALTSGGAAYCWGENERGQVGDGSTVDRLAPIAVAGGLAFETMDAGFRHTCGRTTAGTVYCWGAGAAGQLGSGANGDVPAPTRVAGQP